MGEKGSKQTQTGANAAEALVDALGSLGHVTSRKMFGGFGVFCEDTMFALIDPSGATFLRADDTTAESFETAGSSRHARMPYWQIPASVLSDDNELLEWARSALEVAQAAKR